jgi:hypothetical protein
MGRSITTAVNNALAADNVPLLIFTELDFESGMVRLCNAEYTFSWNGYDWLGLGRMGSIDVIQEGADLQPYGISLTITGIDSANVSTALNEQYQNRACRIWLAPLTDNYEVIADPVLNFRRRMDNMNLQIGATASITLTAENRLADWNRPRVRRFNNDDQISIYPNDKGFEFIHLIVDKVLNWGRA